MELQHTHQPRVLFGISTDLKSAGAFASSDGCIVVSLGMLIGIMQYFSMVTCHPELLMEWGNPAEEKWPRPTEENQIVLGYLPHNQERTLICRLLQRMALRFIISHELTHILHGHLRLRSVASAPYYYLDETLRPIHKEEALERQTLETDADIGAIPECLGDSAIWTDTFNDGQDRDWLNGSNLLLTHEKQMNLWLFALYSLFRVMSDNRIEPSLTTASHPRPMFRVMNFYLHLDERLQTHSDDRHRDSLAKAFAKAILDGKKAFRLLGINPVSTDSSGDAALGSFEVYSSLINQKWSKLRPALTQLKTISTDLPFPLIKVQGTSVDKLLQYTGLKQ